MKATCRRLIRGRINDCHRRLNYSNDKLLLCLTPTSLLDNVTTIADKPANKTTEQHHAIVQSKLTRLQHAAHMKGHKTDNNWVRNISSRPLDKKETHVLSYGLKHSVTPKHIPTDDIIISSVESVLARQRELTESTKDDIRSRIASTLQSTSLTDCNLTKDKLHQNKTSVIQLYYRLRCRIQQSAELYALTKLHKSNNNNFCLVSYT